MSGGADDAAVAPPPPMFLPLPGGFFDGGDNEVTNAEGASLIELIKAELPGTNLQLFLIHLGLVSMAVKKRRNEWISEQVSQDDAMFQLFVGLNFIITFNPAESRINIDVISRPAMHHNVAWNFSGPEAWNFPDDAIVVPATFWVRLSEIFPHTELWKTQAGADVHFKFIGGHPNNISEIKIDDTTDDGIDRAFVDISMHAV